jgi:hypothetical protein
MATFDFTYQTNFVSGVTINFSTSSGSPDVFGYGDTIRFRYVDTRSPAVGGSITISGFNSDVFTNTGNITLNANAGYTSKTTQSSGSGLDTLLWDHSDNGEPDYNHYVELFNADTQPDQFTCPADVTGADVSTVYYSNTGTTTNNNTLDGNQRITGVNTSVDVNITGTGATFQLWNGSAWGSSITSGTANNNTYFRILITSDSGAGVGRTATLTIGNPSVQDTWTVTTIDDQPDAFSFSDISNTGTSTQIASAPIVLSGFSSSATASVSTTNSGQMSINGGAWTSTNTTVNSGDSVAVRLTTGALFNTGYDVTLTTTGDTTSLTRSDTFTATTALDPGSGETIANNFVAPYSLRDIMRFFGGDDSLYTIRADNMRAYDLGGDNVPDVTGNNQNIGTSIQNIKLSQFNNTETRLRFDLYPPTRQDIRFHSNTTGTQNLAVDWDANGEYEIGYSPGMWSICDFRYNFTVDSITGGDAGSNSASDVTCSVSTNVWLSGTAAVTLNVIIGEFEDVTYSGTFTVEARNEYDTSKVISAVATWTMAHIDDVN